MFSETPPTEKKDEGGETHVGLSGQYSFIQWHIYIYMELRSKSQPLSQFCFKNGFKKGDLIWTA